MLSVPTPNRTFQLSQISAAMKLAAVAIAFILSAGSISARRLPIKIYTSADGLGSGFVDFLYRDRRGFMWFCTRDGLSRFDGTNFVTYQVGDTGAAPGIESIFETSKGIYWISTTAGTYRFDPNTSTPSSAGTQRLSGELVTRARGKFLEDRNGTVWVASDTLYSIDENEGKAAWVRYPLEAPGLAGTKVLTFDMAESVDGSLWINSDHGLIRKLPDSHLVFYRDDYVITSGESSLLADRSGRIWLIRGSRVLVLKPEPPETIDSGPSVTIRSLEPTEKIELKLNEPIDLPRTGGTVVQLTHRDLIERTSSKKVFQSSKGDIWLSSENNLLKFGSEGTELITSADGLPNVNVKMEEDNAGNLWIAGQSSLARLDLHGFVTYDSSDGLRSSRFYSVGEIPGKGLYFGQSNFQLSFFDGTRFETAAPAIELDTKILWTSRIALHSSDGDWWVLTGDGLNRFSGISKFSDLEGRKPTKVYTEKDGLKSSGAFQIFEDSAGDIWVSTRGLSPSGNGVARMRKGETSFHVFGESEGLPASRSPSSFAEDTYGNIWMGFYEGGLAKFDGDRFHIFTSADGLPKFGVISDLLVDAKGRLWIASSNFGVLHLDDTSAPKPEFGYIGLENGLRSSNVRTLTEDRFGRIYAGTARGVDRISPDTLNIKNYTVADGLASDFVVDSNLDSNGDIWFATNSGVSRLTPVPDEKSANPQVFLGGVSIAGVERSISQIGEAAFEPGELSPSENNLQIRFFGLDFRAGEFLKFQYKLEGADADWSSPNAETTVTYANLKQGTYRFQVRAVNSEGAISESPATVSFVILSPIWQRWWFISIVIVVVAGLIIWLYRYRIAQLNRVNAALEEARRAEERLRRSREERLMELERVRLRIATDLHDDIGASLTQIAILSEVAQTAGNGNENKVLSGPLTKITEVSNQLVGTMSDIVWSINPSKDHLSDLAQRMRRFAADTLSARGINVKFDLPGLDSEVSLNSNVRRELFLVFKEAVNNIAKHSNAENVTVSIRLDLRSVSLQITDDGIGINEAAPSIEEIHSSSGNSGTGLTSMKKRALEMNGIFDLRSIPGKGTSIRLELPLEEAFDESIVPNAERSDKV